MILLIALYRLFLPALTLSFIKITGITFRFHKNILFVLYPFYLEKILLSFLTEPLLEVKDAARLYGGRSSTG